MSRGAGAHRRDHGQSGPQSIQLVLSHLESNLDRQALYDLCKIPSGVVWRQERELRSAGRCDLLYFAPESYAWIRVDANLGRVARTDVTHLRFLEIRLHPNRLLHQ